MIKETCFAWTNGKCSALSKADCACCSFYKTKTQAKNDRKKADDRLNRLGLYPAECVIDGVKYMMVQRKFSYSA